MVVLWCNKSSWQALSTSAGGGPGGGVVYRANAIATLSGGGPILKRGGVIIGELWVAGKRDIPVLLRPTLVSGRHSAVVDWRDPS